MKLNILDEVLPVLNCTKVSHFKTEKLFTDFQELSNMSDLIKVGAENLFYMYQFQRKRQVVLNKTIWNLYNRVTGWKP